MLFKKRMTKRERMMIEEIDGWIEAYSTDINELREMMFETDGSENAHLTDLYIQQCRSRSAFKSLKSSFEKLIEEGS